MKIRKFNASNANLVRSPGQDGEILVWSMRMTAGQSPSDTVATVPGRA